MKSIRTVIEKANGKMTLGETTPVKLGLVLIIFGILIAGVWRAAEISTKLDMVMLTISTIKDDNKILKSDVDTIKLWKAEIDRSGSRALDDVRKEVMLLREEFKIHANLNSVKKP